MKLSRSVNPCNPGFRSSCALCCGSHNFSHISDPVAGPDNPAPGNGLLPLFEDAMHCPHIICIDPESKRIGCSIYSDRRLCLPSIEQFFDKTCATFFCRAWEVLSDDEVLFAARLMGDWYFYSLLIQDIPALQAMFRSYGDPDVMPAEKVLEIKHGLGHLIHSG